MKAENFTMISTGDFMGSKSYVKKAKPEQVLTVSYLFYKKERKSIHSSCKKDKSRMMKIFINRGWWQADFRGQLLTLVFR